jgi:hypothetical protein
MEVPGTADMWTMKCPSLSSGMKLVWNSGSAAQPAIVKATAAPISERGLRATACKRFS